MFPNDDDRIRWVPGKVVAKLSKPLRKLYSDFSIIRHGKYGSPRDFDKLTPSWYLNHSDTPNVAADRQYKFYALKDIRPGTELTVDYRKYSEPSEPDSKSTAFEKRNGALKRLGRRNG
jgi:hypothetical protein